MRLRDEDARSPSLFYGWWVVLGCLMLVVTSSPCHSFGINVFVPRFIESLGVDSQSVSLTWLTASLTSAALVPTAGVALDRLGARKFVSLLAIPFVVNLLLLSRVTDWWSLTACVTLLRFIGAECFCLAASATVQRWFVRRRGRATALLSLSGIVLMEMPIFLSLLVDGIGWRSSYQALAVALGIVLAGALLLIRAEPQAMGLLPDGDAPAAPSIVCKGQKGDGTSGGGDGGGGDFGGGEGGAGGGVSMGDSRTSHLPPLEASSLRAAAGHPLFWCLAALNLFNDIFWAGFNYHFLSVSASLGGALGESSELALARAYFAPLSVGLNGAQLGVGLVVIDRVPVASRARLTALVHLAAAFIMSSSLFVRSEAALSAFGFVYGVAAGTRGACLAVVLSSLFGTRALGRIQAVQQGSLVLSTGIGPLLWALSDKYTGGYVAVITFAAAGLGAAALIMLMADRYALGRVRARGDQSRVLQEAAPDVETPSNAC